MTRGGTKSHYKGHKEVQRTRTGANVFTQFTYNPLKLFLVVPYSTVYIEKFLLLIEVLVPDGHKGIFQWKNLTIMYMISPTKIRRVGKEKRLSINKMYLLI